MVTVYMMEDLPITLFFKPAQGFPGYTQVTGYCFLWQPLKQFGVLIEKQIEFFFGRIPE
jgi:hypothetical protein